MSTTSINPTSNADPSTCDTTKRNASHFSSLRRRDFLGTLASGALAASAPYFVTRSALGAPGRPGANDRIRIGAIGVGGRATLLLEQLPEEAEIVALCDCDLPRAEEFKAKKKGTWPVYQDYRRILDRQDVDAVIVATGDFQRARPCVDACMAGKDVYAEKPLTLYIHEGRVLVNAARQYERIFQVGTQQRSMAVNRVACELVRSGGLGRVLEVRAMNYTPASPSPSEPFPEQTVPPGLDWNMWLNQAAMRPYHEKWKGWSQWREFGGGEMTNWGAHGVDQIQWALGMDESGPVEVHPISDGAPGQISMKYAHGVPVNFILEQGRGPMGGAVFICEKGKLEINRNKFVSNPPEIAAQLAKQLDLVEEERKWSDQTALWQARWHMQNWLDCMRTRERPVADVEIGHRSVTICHLANLARELGRPLRWDPATEQFVNDDDANLHLNRPRRAEFELPKI